MLRKASNLNELLETCPYNGNIIDSFVKAWSVVNNSDNKKLICNVSGGSDSDIMLDLIWRVDINNKVDYVWFDTGMEYQATKDHLKELKAKYGINISTQKAKIPVPAGCRKYGLPFVSKRVSEMIHRLQAHGFLWEDGDFGALLAKYPNCKSALKWWCNENSRVLNIENNAYLKEFMMLNPPTFSISDMCCHYAKKEAGNSIVRKNNYQVRIEGIRKAEGGQRSFRYKSCFSANTKAGCDDYRPLFWYTNKDKVEYEKNYGIVHSKCYSEYGLKRTGCSGCPFGRNFEEELLAIEKYEPKLFKAATYVFNNSYEYTRRYREFVKKLKEENQAEGGKIFEND